MRNRTNPAATGRHAPRGDLRHTTHFTDRRTAMFAERHELMARVLVDARIESMRDQARVARLARLSRRPVRRPFRRRVGQFMIRAGQRLAAEASPEPAR